MKNYFYKLLLSAFLLIQANFAFSQTADLQIIHNSADPAIDTVDVYVNGVLTFDNFVFRTATPFTSVPAGIPLEVGIAPENSASVSDTIKNFTVTFVANGRYVVMATGVLNPGNFALNPDGLSTAFDLIIQGNIRSSVLTPGNAEFIIVHGVTDAPISDVLVRYSSTLFNDGSYREVSAYSSAPAITLLVDITDSAQTSIYKTYNVDLSLFADSTLVLFTSGFKDTSVNQGGPQFGLFGALTDGTIIEFFSLQIAYLQAIHNCSDPAADSLDIYALGFLAVDNFKYRTATTFLGVPAGDTLNVGVALGNSTSVNDTIRNFPVVLENGKTYIAMAVGVIDTSTFAPNPDGKDISFNLLTVDYAKLSPTIPGNVDYIGIHGCTDAPTIDVVESLGGVQIIDNAAFGDATSYIETTPALTYVNVTPGNNNSVILGSFQADLTALGDQTAVIFASGFMDPAANQNGPAFGLWAALKDGTVYPLLDVTSVEDIENSSNPFILSPNPASDYTMINLKNSGQLNQKLIITNATGQEVVNYYISKGLSNFKLQTSVLNKGLYFVKIIGDNKISVKKLIVN